LEGRVVDPWKGGEAMTMYEAWILALSAGNFLGLLGLMLVLAKNIKK
jgi:hypothetical protein